VSRVKASLAHNGIRRLVWLVLTILVLLGYSLQSVAGDTYYSLLMQTYTTVDSPPVILQNGTAGTSTIYTNSTSAKVSVEAPLFDYVDNNDYDVDSNADKGTHSDFNSEKAVDGVDTLSEEDTGTMNSDIFIDDFEDQTFNKWDDNGATSWLISSAQARGSYSAESESTHQGDLISDDIDLSQANYAGFSFWTYATAVDANEFLLYFYNGTAYNLIKDLDVSDDVWNYHSENVDSQYFVSNFRIKIYTTGLGALQDVYVDDVTVNKTSINYELDLEIQWTNANYTRTNEELCVKTGTFSGSEDIQVKVWNETGSSWHWIMNLTASQWNNVSITSYLTSSTFTVQFLGGTETGDTTQDNWNIDATLLHVWTAETFDYVLKVNNNVTGSWQIRLKKYAESNINRLQNCTIYFHNSTDGASNQIYIQNGGYINQTGPWYDLGGSETIYIAMTAQANSTGTSYVRVYLEILTSGTTTYAQYVIAFEIT